MVDINYDFLIPPEERTFDCPNDLEASASFEDDERCGGCTGIGAMDGTFETHCSSCEHYVNSSMDYAQRVA